MIIRCYKFQFTVSLRTRLYLDHCADNNSSQIPSAKRLFYCKSKQIFTNIKWLPFFHTHLGAIHTEGQLNNLAVNIVVLIG